VREGGFRTRQEVEAAPREEYYRGVALLALNDLSHNCAVRQKPKKPAKKP
jgi:hypothetical protein